MSAPTPPHLVRTLVAKGCMGDFADGGSAFNPDESIALVRWFVRLLRDRTPCSGDAVVETFAGVADASLQRHRIAQPLACAKGCAACCHQAISVNAVEVFAVARKLRRSRDLGSHRTRLAARPVPDDGRVFDVARACGFLTGGICGIHAFRPAVCRTYASLDARACVRRLETDAGLIPVPRAHEPIRGWLNTALWAAHHAAGLDARTFDLSGAVAAVLDDPGIEARWYAGDADALAAVADPPLPPHVLPGIARMRALAKV